MRLREVIPGTGGDDPEITGLAYDNRRVGPGTLFFCVSGFTRDGHDFAPDAVARGAAALVVERPLGLGVPEVRVESARAAMAPAAARFYGDPTAALDVIGITGTNGKTTSAWIVRDLLEALGRRTGLIGTVKTVIAGAERKAIRTTGEAIDLQADFRAMADGGDAACAMEVSSHALELHRADAIHFAVAAFTNLTQDHLDFHGDMESYFAAKRSLFVEHDVGTALLGVDDAYGRRLAAELPDAVTFAIDQPATLRARDLATGLAGSTFTLEAPEGAVPLRVPIPGRFNVENVLCAIGSVRALGVGLEEIADALARGVRGIPGRFQPVEAGQPFAVLVDYSHTPDSIENVLREARGIAEGRVICVFGCGGDRDRGKRPLMGAAAAAGADLAILTSDNPRSEDPAAIAAEALAGIEDRSGVEVELDRRRAIARAVEAAGPGDVVVIAGKGHEQGQEFAGGRVEPFDDVVVAREALGGPVAR
jgi:UDP-N-acetylmuramoyl-L-alanyl-D-glutamate--2,6-diaminopimelate ligase